MRLFIAINLNDETKAALIALQNELRAYSKSGSFTLPENLHLTLAFLGECDEKQTEQIKSIMGKVVFQPFDLKVMRVGQFKRDGGDVWWAGIQDIVKKLEKRSTRHHQKNHVKVRFCASDA